MAFSMRTNLSGRVASVTSLSDKSLLASCGFMAADSDLAA